MGGCAWILCRSPIVAHHGSPAAQQCTQTPQSGAERPDPPICVHYCDPKATHNPSPQPNSVHKRPKLTSESPDPPICVHYRGHAGPPAAQQCTQTPQFGAERPDPPICVHSCGPLLPKKADRYLGRTCLQARGPGHRRGAEPDGDNQRGRRHGRRDIGKQLQCPCAWQPCAGVFGLLCPFRKMTKAVDLRMYAGPAFCGINFLNAPGFEWGA